MTTKYAGSSRPVIIERGSKGFGFALKGPRKQESASCDFESTQGEPYYTFGAQVRCVEDQGPARRGGLEKDDYVVTINKEIVRGKTYFDVMKIIQATNRLLTLEIANPPTWSENYIEGEQSIEGESDEHVMEEALAEKENQGALQLNLASPGDPVPVPQYSSVSVVVPSRSAAMFTEEESQQIIREFDRCALDHADNDEDEDNLSFHRSRRQVRPQPSLSPSSLSSSKSIGLARSTGHLEKDQGEQRPTVTFKKAYDQQGISSSSVAMKYNSIMTGAHASASRRTSLGVGTQGARPSAEPRINIKKRKSGNSGGGIGANYPSAPSVAVPPNSGSFRAQSISHIPNTNVPLTGITSTARQNPTASVTVSSTLMHSPMRRGSSPARSIGVSSSGPVAPLSGVEEFDNSIPTSPSNSSSATMHETRFSMIPDKVITFRHGGASDGSDVFNSYSPRSRMLKSDESRIATDEVEGRIGTASGVRPVHSALRLQPHDLSALSSSYTSSSTTSTSTTSTTSTTINIQRNHRSHVSQQQLAARQHFMTSNPTPPPPIPVNFVTPPHPTSITSPVQEQNTSVLRRGSYINAVKATGTTVYPSDVIAEGEEQDEDSVLEDTADGQGYSLQKTRKFFGEPGNTVVQISSSCSSSTSTSTTVIHRQVTQWSRRSARNNKAQKLREALATSGSTPASSSEKKFNLSVKVVREDGKETKSKSWKSFSLTIENDVMHLIRERKESSASSSSSAEESPIPLRQCTFEWTSPDQARKKYLVCRMYVNPPSPPLPHDSTSSSTSAPPLSSSAPSTTAQPVSSASSASLHSSSPPAEQPGVSEYKLQFSNAEEMQAFCRCLPESAATVNVIGGPSDLTATYPPPAKVGKKLAKAPIGGRFKDFELLSASHSSTNDDQAVMETSSTKPKLLSHIMRNIRWKSSSTEGASTTTTIISTKMTRGDDFRTLSPGEVSRPLPGSTFGAPLSQVPRSSFSPYVPLVVELCSRIVESCGMHCVGVYRVSAKKAVIDSLEAELNECGSRLELINRSNERWNDIHAVSGLLKCFLRKMPDPVFPFGLYSGFLEASDRNLPHQQRMLHLQRLLAIMDSDSPDVPVYKHHRETLKYIAQHLHRVASHSHINKMTTKNLVSMIAPNVFRPPGDNVNLLMQATAQGATILELVVHYHEWLFSPELMEAGCAVPPPLPTDTGPSIIPVEHCGGDHEAGETVSHNTEEALGGAEDRGRNTDVQFRAGEKAADILAAILDSAMPVQSTVPSETLSSLDEGGFDEVDIDAAVKRREQMNEAAAANSATSYTSSSSSSNPVVVSSSTLIEATYSIPINTNSSNKPIAEETDNVSFRSERRGSASYPSGQPSDWSQLHQRAEEQLKRDGGRWFGAAAITDPISGVDEVPGPPLPPRRYDAEIELKLRRHCHAKQIIKSKSLESLNAQVQAGIRPG